MRTDKEAEIEKALLEGTRWNIIAKTLHVSNRTIAKVAKRLNELSPSQVFKMFEKGDSPIDIVIKTNGEPKKITEWFEEWKTQNEKWRSWRQFEEARTASSAVEKDGDKHKKEGERDWRDVLKRRNRKD